MQQIKGGSNGLSAPLQMVLVRHCIWSELTTAVKQHISFQRECTAHLYAVAAGLSA